jgi:hypothetical protein
MGDDRGDTAPADRGYRCGLAQRMTGGELTLGAVLARLEEREREIAVQAESTREQIAQLAARLDELGRAAEEVRITRKTLLELPDPQPPTPPAPKLPDHPAYQQIMAVLSAADAPLRARQVCEAMDLETAPNNINNTRLKLKRLTERGILVETEQGLFTQRRPSLPSDVVASPLALHERAKRTSTHVPPGWDLWPKCPVMGLSTVVAGWCLLVPSYGACPIGALPRIRRHHGSDRPSRPVPSTQHVTTREEPP